jgi:type IV secretion system protein VirB3
MMETMDMNVQPLFSALTRPPMMLGVTLDYLGVSGVIAICLFIAVGNPLYFLACIPLHVVGWLLCRMDVNMFRVLFKKLDCPPVGNKRYWGCQSYEPY